MAADVIQIREQAPTAPPRPSSSWGAGPHQPSHAMSGYWTPPRMRAALDANDAGMFEGITSLKANVTRDPRVGGQGGVRGQRVSVPLGLPIELKLPDGRESSDQRSPAARVLEASKPLLKHGFGPLEQAYLEGELADFGLGFATLTWEPSAGGGAMMPKLEQWPLSAVSIDENGALVAELEDGKREKITPGDGRWVMISATLARPWEEGAVRSASSAWLARAHVVRDGNRFTEAAGQNPIIGTVPVGTLEPQRAAYDRDLKLLTAGFQGMTKYEGYSVERLKSNAEQIDVFLKHSGAFIADIAVAYLGQDGTSQKGDTGTYGSVKVLDGVRYDIAERDVKALTAVWLQIAVPFAYYNFGRADLAPTIYYALPDMEEDARKKAERDEVRAGRKAFFEEIREWRANGVKATAAQIAEVAEAHKVVLSPGLAKALAMGMAERAEQAREASEALAGGPVVGYKRGGAGKPGLADTHGPARG